MLEIRLQITCGGVQTQSTSAAVCT